MGNTDLLQVDPIELQFPFELKKQMQCDLKISNMSNNDVAFKVQTTNPKKYYVCPNQGIVLPHSTCYVTVTMQAQKDTPADFQCKDKFKIQSVVVSPGVSEEDITQELFNKGSGNHVEECKLRVSYVPPPLRNGDLLHIDPVQLQFPKVDTNERMSSFLQLNNNSPNYVAYMVKTTNPKMYFVKANQGVVLPHSSCEVTVTKQAQKDAPTYLSCEDKVMIHSVVVKPGASEEDELFNKESGNQVEECILRISYVPPRKPQADYRLANPKGADWRGKLISLFGNLQKVFLKDKAIGDNGATVSEIGAQRKASAQFRRCLLKDIIDQVVSQNEVESEKGGIKRDPKMDGFIAASKDSTNIGEVLLANKATDPNDVLKCLEDIDFNPKYKRKAYFHLCRNRVDYEMVMALPLNERESALWDILVEQRIISVAKPSTNLYFCCACSCVYPS